MPYFVAFRMADESGSRGRESRFRGVGNTAYESLDAAVEAARSGKVSAVEKGIPQRYSVVEAASEMDALMFAYGARPPREVMQHVWQRRTPNQRPGCLDRRQRRASGR